MDEENLIGDETLDTLETALGGVCPAVDNVQTPNSIKLYEVAAASLGSPMVPKGYNPVLGCAISLNQVYKKAFSIDIGGDASTYMLWQALKKQTDKFKQVNSPLPGDIIMCATGTQPANSPIRNGHTGIVAKYGILSNNSNNGLWSE